MFLFSIAAGFILSLRAVHTAILHTTTYWTNTVLGYNKVLLCFGLLLFVVAPVEIKQSEYKDCCVSRWVGRFVFTGTSEYFICGTNLFLHSHSSDTCKILIHILI